MQGSLRAASFFIAIAGNAWYNILGIPLDEEEKK